MYQHGPSLLPNAIDVQYSRGHPLLFYASAAAWMRLFGDSNTAQHSYALCIAVLCLITTYEVCLRLFNRRTAEIGLLLVATQVIFFCAEHHVVARGIDRLAIVAHALLLRFRQVYGHFAGMYRPDAEQGERHGDGVDARHSRFH